MSNDLTARARKRAEELEQAASGIPAPPYSYRSWRHDDWGMVRNHQGPVANTAMQSMISRWRAEVYDKIEGDPRPAWEAGPPETQALGEFLVHAANTANENAGLLTALAARVDEQERRIKELERGCRTVITAIGVATRMGIVKPDGLSEVSELLTEALSQKGGE